MKTYRIGVIGAGFMGHVHSYCWSVIPFFYKNLDYRCVLHAVCTSKEATATAARDELGFAKSYTDQLALINDPDVDVIDIATPNSLHMDALLAVDHAGKKVYCDKPLTGNLNQALQLEQSLTNPAQLGQMTLQYRFYPATLRARLMIAEGKIGDVINYRIEYLHSGNVAPGKKMVWKDMRAFGAGVLYDLGSHAIDLLTWLCGAGVAEVSARQKTLHKLRPSAQNPGTMFEQDTDDMTIILATLTNGALGTLEVSKIATGAQDELRFEIHGTRGALRFNLMQPDYLDYFDLADPEMPLGGTSGYKHIHCLQRYEAPAGFPGPKFTIGWLRGHLHCLYSFIDAVHTGKPFDPSIARGIELEKWLDGVAQAASSSNTVKLA
jgi:predicted dehydrogenase